MLSLIDEQVCMWADQKVYKSDYERQVGGEKWCWLKNAWKPNRLLKIENTWIREESSLFKDDNLCQCTHSFSNTWIGEIFSLFEDDYLFQCPKSL